MKPNIKQLSELTGFSPATVSNALNRKKTVNPETASKIWQAAQQAGYRQSTRISKIRLVVCRKHGQIVNDSPFFSSLISGVESECRRLGFSTIISHLDWSASDFDNQLAQILHDRTAANLILATEFNEDDAQQFASAQTPLVLLDCWLEAMDYDTVSIDNTDSTFIATSYLIRKGHTRIGYLKSATEIQNFRFREYGYRRAMLRYELNMDPANTLVLDPSMDGSRKDLCDYLAQQPQLPTAFVADNDNIALGACKALQDAGYRIPEDVSVIGFDDMPFCEIASPPLTTVRVFKQEMGAAAVRRLADVLNGELVIRAKIQICTEFIERASVKDINQETANNNGEKNNGKSESQDV